jgi:ubiquitin C-terminal hydrolase
MSVLNTMVPVGGRKAGILKPSSFSSSSAKYELKQTSARSSANYSKHAPIGSKNHGNTCFLNATLQAVASCESLAPAMLKEHSMLRELHDKNEFLATFNSSSSQLNQDLLDSLIKSIYYLRNHDVLEAGPTSTHERKTVDTYITNLIKRFPQFPNPTLKIGTQEDAHEFYINILLILQNTRSYYQSMADAYLRGNYPKGKKRALNRQIVNFPFVASLFEGKVVSTVYCLECGHVSQRPELFLDIPLEIQSTRSLQESFNQHFE